MKSLNFFILFTFILTATEINAQKSDSIKIYYNINEVIPIASEIKKISTFNNFNNIQKIEICSFCDFLGTFEYNINLAKKRATYIETLVKQEFKNVPVIVKYEAYYPGTSEKLRSDLNDRGIKEHRVSILKFYFYNENNFEITSQPETTLIETNSNNNKISEIDSFTIPIVRTGIEEQILNIMIDSKKETQNIKLKNINFKGGTPLFLPESHDALTELLYIMKKYPELKIEIHGHICCQEADAGDGWDIINENYSLSLNRAKAVYDFLVNNGIDSNRLAYKGFAATQKIYPSESNEYELQQNRRVEIKVLK